jgi:hypothetical protein
MKISACLAFISQFHLHSSYTLVSIILGLSEHGVKPRYTKMIPSTVSQAQTPSQAIDIPISPKPKHFLVRPGTNGIVPLIALDELPKFISLHGVPRSLNLEDTAGMTSLGNVEGEGGYYDVVVGAGVEAAGLEAVEKDCDSSSASSGSGSGSGSGNGVRIAAEAAQ